MPLAPVRFGSSLVIDSGGTGLRIDFSTEDGQMYPDHSDKFWGSANVPYAEVEKLEPLTPQAMFKHLVDGFVSKRLKSTKTYLHQGQEKTIRQILKEDPIKRVFVATAGQIKQDPQQGFPFITAADNVRAVMKEMDFLGAFREALLKRFEEEQCQDLLDKPSFMQKGWIFNDALAGVMSLAKHLETKVGAQLTEESPNYIFMDVGSGIATGGIDGNQLYTAESQNARIWFKPEAERIQRELLNPTGETAPLEGATFEDFGAMRGMTQQSVMQLRRLSPEVRLQHPAYQAMCKVAIDKDNHNKSKLFNGKNQAFDYYFSKTPVAELKDQAWQEKWLNFDRVLLPIYLKNKKDPVAGPVVDMAFDALAALAAFKIMEHKAKRVYLQFIDMDFAVKHVNETLPEGSPPIENPLAEEVNRRLWEKMLHPAIAKTCFDPEGVVISNLRNPDGIGYLSEALKPERANQWKVQGIPSSQLGTFV